LPSLLAHLQDSGDLLRLNYTLANLRGNNGTTLATFRSLTPTKVIGKLCFAAPSTIDRAWRKKNKAYPRLSANCPFKFSSAPFNASSDPAALKTLNTGSLVMNFNDQDMIPTATWFAMLW
jgi:hypothetical protein